MSWKRSSVSGDAPDDIGAAIIASLRDGELAANGVYVLRRLAPLPPGGAGRPLLLGGWEFLAAEVTARDPARHLSARHDTPERHQDMTQDRCTCGYQAENPDDLAIHFGEMFIPDDDTAPDGQAHNEAAQDKHRPSEPQAPRTLTCRCGFTATADDFDHHLLAIFTPADRIGLDSKRHAPAAPATQHA
jgi:hypothetical protein